jgi:hypothetical protein
MAFRSANHNADPSPPNTVVPYYLFDPACAPIRWVSLTKSSFSVPSSSTPAQTTHDGQQFREGYAVESQVQQTMLLGEQVMIEHFASSILLTWIGPV